MKAMWLLGLLSLLLMAAYNDVDADLHAEAQNLNRSAAAPVPANTDAGDKLPARFFEYLFLHQTRYEEFPVHAMADVKTCPE